tara:strand:+ start:18266 stop:18445 length:180 start_codon:yes stop_codon:yes gene_type:complete
VIVITRERSVAPLLVQPVIQYWISLLADDVTQHYGTLYTVVLARALIAVHANTINLSAL